MSLGFSGSFWGAFGSGPFGGLESLSAMIFQVLVSQRVDVCHFLPPKGSQEKGLRTHGKHLG